MTEQTTDVAEPGSPNWSAGAPVDIAEETMLGDLMSLTLDELKHAQDAWQKLSEADQDATIDRIEARTRQAIVSAVRMIATQGFVRLPATLESVTVKDSIKATLSIAKTDPSRHELFDATGCVLTVVLADISQFVEKPHGHKGDPAQLDLIVANKLDQIGDASKDDEG